MLVVTASVSTTSGVVRASEPVDVSVTGLVRGWAPVGVEGPLSDGNVLIRNYDGDESRNDAWAVWWITVTNPSDHCVPVRFRWAVHPEDDPGTGKWEWTARGGITGPFPRNSSTNHCDSDRRYCDLNFPPGDWEFWGRVEGWAPGAYGFEAWATTPDDPDKTNNRFLGSGHVLCDQMGTPEADVLVGRRGAESLCGLGGDDLITNLGVFDQVWGGAGDDRIVAGPSWQHLFGGPGSDTADFSEIPVPLSISLADEAAQPIDPDDYRSWLLVRFENVIATMKNDYVEGSRKINVLLGRAGRDELFGRGGQDRLFGGRGKDEFHSRDRVRDLVFGGPRSDSTFANGFDRVISSRRSGSRLFSDQDPEAS